MELFMFHDYIIYKYIDIIELAHLFFELKKI